MRGLEPPSSCVQGTTSATDLHLGIVVRVAPQLPSPIEDAAVAYGGPERNRRTVTKRCNRPYPIDSRVDVPVSFKAVGALRRAHLWRCVFVRQEFENAVAPSGRSCVPLQSSIQLSFDYPCNTVSSCNQDEGSPVPQTWLGREDSNLQGPVVDCVW